VKERWDDKIAAAQVDTRTLGCDAVMDEKVARASVSGTKLIDETVALSKLEPAIRLIVSVKGISTPHTGARVPEVLEEKKNWEWHRAEAGNIIGMKLLRTAAATPAAAPSTTTASTMTAKSRAKPSS